MRDSLRVFGGAVVEEGQPLFIANVATFKKILGAQLARLGSLDLSRCIVSFVTTAEGVMILVRDRVSNYIDISCNVFHVSRDIRFALEPAAGVV